MKASKFLKNSGILPLPGAVPLCRSQETFYNTSARILWCIFIKFLLLLSESYYIGTHNRARTFYCGFDPTAPSLHLGNLTALMLLMQVQRRGHSVIALVGGSTAMIGDPSGRLRERDKMEEHELLENTAQVTSTLVRLFENHEKIVENQKYFPGKTDFDLLWLKKEFCRITVEGKTVNRDDQNFLL